MTKLTHSSTKPQQRHSETPIRYKFNEEKLLLELQDYIDRTYASHYSKDRDYQAFEFIVDCGYGMGFTLGDILKYAQRYGAKGDSPEEWRKDLVKIVHYGLLALYCHDKEYSREGDSS